METALTAPHKQTVSFRWDSDLVGILKKMAKKEKRSLSNLTETLLSYAVRGEEEPNEATYAALKEAMKHQDMAAEGLPDDGKYIDTSSVDAMIKSTLA